MHNKIIPYHLINKAVCGTLNCTEEYTLNDWLTASQDNLSLFHSLEVMIDHSKNYSTNVEFDAAAAYDTFESNYLSQSPSEIDKEIWDLAKNYNPSLSFNKKKAVKKFTKKISGNLDRVDSKIWKLAKDYDPNVEFDSKKAFATFQSQINKDSKTTEDKSLWDISAGYVAPVSFDSDKAVDRFFDKYKIHKEELGIDEQIWNLSKSYSPDISFDATQAADKFIYQNIKSKEIIGDSISQSELNKLISNYDPKVDFNSKEAYSTFLAKYGNEITKGLEIVGSEVQDNKEAKIVRMKPTAMIMRIAASFTILIASLLTWQNMSSPEMITLSGPGEYVLSDASTVFLNADSELTFPEKFAKDKREVKLDGEAYFDIHKNPEKPFTIGVGSVKVDVLGTAFEITEIDDEIVVVTVDEGVVKVENDGVVDTLIQGERAVANLITGDINSSIIEYEKHSAWKDLGLSFEDVNVKDVLQEMELFYGITFDIKITEEHMEESLLVGNQFKFTSIKENLEVIEEVTHTKITKVKPGHYQVTK